MPYQIVHSRVTPERRARYLAAWSRWSAATLTMGIETRLLESEERSGEFVEITRFDEATAAALGDDRLVRIEAELDAAAERREGSLRLYREARSTEVGPPDPDAPGT